MTDAYKMYCATGPAIAANTALSPLANLSSMAETVYATPTVVRTVNVTVAIPSELVVDAGDEKEPPLPLLLQVTTRPAVFEAFW